MVVPVGSGGCTGGPWCILLPAGCSRAALRKKTIFNTDTTKTFKAGGLAPNGIVPRRVPALSKQSGTTVHATNVYCSL